GGAGAARLVPRPREASRACAGWSRRSACGRWCSGGRHGGLPLRQRPAYETKNAGINEKRAQGALFLVPDEPDQAMALTAAARRLLWRAALFLWMMFLSATRSMTLAAFCSVSVATVLSP